MSDKYSTTDAYECSVCGSLHDHSSLAEKCYTKCNVYRLMEEIAELRIRGGITKSDIEHKKTEISSMVEDLEEARDELEGVFGDDCDHGEHMKHVQINGGMYCSACGKQVNEYPKDPQTFNI